MAQLFISSNEFQPIYMNKGGARRLPTLDKSTKLNILALKDLMSSEKHSISTRGDLAAIVNKLSNVIVSQLEDMYGPLDAENGLIFVADDGGFVCGSTGKPPIPLLPEQRKDPSPEELIRRGIIDQTMINLLDRASKDNVDLSKVLENPKEFAGTVGIDITSLAEQELKAIAPSQVEKIQDPEKREMAQFFAKVLEDGRYINTWLDQPVTTAEALDYKLSERLHNNISRARASYGGIDVMNPIVLVGVGILASITATVATDASSDNIPTIRDLSGVNKL